MPYDFIVEAQKILMDKQVPKLDRWFYIPYRYHKKKRMRKKWNSYYTFMGLTDYKLKR